MSIFENENLDHFASLSAQWWDTNGPLKTLHDINPLRVQFIKDRISLSGKNILDVGCGAGLLTEALAQQKATVTGIDIVESSIQAAKTHAKISTLDIHYICDDIAQLALQQPQQFDCITCMEMLEHVEDPSAILESLRTLLKPGGHCFLSTINRTLKSYVQAIVGAEYVLGLVPKHTHDFQYFLKPSELTVPLRKLGFSIKEIKGMHYDPISHQASLRNDVDVNYFIHAIL